MIKTEFENLIKNYQTPFYYFDMSVLKKRIDTLRNNLPSKIKLCYAIKANSFFLKDIEPYIDRFEVCSFGEYHICEKSKIDKQKIVLSGVSKEKEDIESLIKNNTPIGIYTIESWSQYLLLKELTKKYQTTIKVLLRMTSGNQFGMDKSVITDIFKENYPNLGIVGLQYFSTTQKRSIKRLSKELEEVLTFHNEIKETYNIDLKEIEFGPGLSVAYFQDEEYDESSYLKEFSELLNTIPDYITVTLELGRSIAYSCGSYFTKVVDLKTNKKENYAIVDGGIHHVVYYGSSLAMRLPELEIYQNNRELNNNLLSWNICGSLCTINDILIKQLPINDLKIGDVLIFKKTGAYSVTEGISLFLSRNLPSVIKKDINGNIQIIRNSLPTHPFNTPNLEGSE